MISRSELVERALAYAGLPSCGDSTDDEDALAGLLTDFRADPEGLRELLRDVPDADEICGRYQVLAEAAGDGSHPVRGAFDVYFVVRRPEPISREGAEQLLRRHYDAMASLAREARANDLARRLAAPVPVEWEAPPQAHLRSVDRERYEVDLEVRQVAANRLGAYTSDHPFLGLHEAAYTIAASYELARWLSWPAYRGVVATPDPYASFVELWRHGVDWARSATRIVAWVEPG